MKNVLTSQMVGFLDLFLSSVTHHTTALDSLLNMGGEGPAVKFSQDGTVTAF
jgi:hypothetical protein